MKRLAPILIWGVTSAMGAYLTAFVFLPLIDAAHVIALVGAVGVILTLAISTTAGLLKEYSNPSFKDLSPKQATRAKRAFQRRRTILWWRYLISILLSLAATVSAWALRITSPGDFHTLFAALTGAALFPAALITILALFETHKLTKVQRELSDELERRRLRMETIGKLGGNSGGNLESKA